MRGVLLSLLFALCWLNPAVALTPAQQSVLSGTNPCAGITLSADFARGVFCKANIRYPSFLAIPGAAFTRASTGYAQWSNGTLQLFASGVPRITDQGLLVEQASTNQLLWSQDLTNATWNKTDSTISGGVSAPDGTTTAQMVTEGSAGTAFVGQSATISAVTQTGSIYLKQGNTAWNRVTVDDGAGTNSLTAWVNLSTCTLGSTAASGASTGLTATVSGLANGWCRFSLSGLNSTATTGRLRFNTATANNSGTRVSGGTYVVWGSQLEALGYSTSYIPTTSASASRAVDVANVTTNVLGSGNFTVVTKARGISPNQTGFFPGLLGINDGFVNNELLEYATNGGPSANGKLVTSAVQQWDVPLSVTAVSGGAVKLAITNNGGTARGAASGQAPVSLGAWSAFTPTQVMLGADGAASNQLNGYINFFSAIPKGVSDTQLQALTR